MLSELSYPVTNKTFIDIIGGDGRDDIIAKVCNPPAGSRLFKDPKFEEMLFTLFKGITEEHAGMPIPESKKSGVFGPDEYPFTSQLMPIIVKVDFVLFSEMTVQMDFLQLSLR